MAVEGENLGTAAIYLTVDTTSMDAGIAKAKTKLAGMSADAEKQYTAMTASQRKVAEGLVKQADLINKTTAERIAYNAQLKVGGALGDEIAAKALANAQATISAQGDATAAAKAADAAKAEMAAADDARYKQIAANAMAEVEARKAVTAATMEQARANAALTEARVTGGAGAATGRAAQAMGALDAATVQQQIADYAALDAVMTKKVVTTEEVAAAEQALDRLQAEGMISNEELAATFAALDVATAADTKILKENAAANVEAAGARKINSRTGYTISALISDAASGQFSRSKREMAALANETGVMSKALTALASPAGAIAATAALLGGAFVVAAIKGEAETDKFSRELLATGQAATFTAGQMGDIVNTVGASTGSYGKADAALNLLAASGKYSAAQFQSLTTTLVNFAEITGGKAADGLKALDTLTGTTKDGLLKLDDQFHFLTQTTYEQIAALEAEGKTDQARELEQKTFSDAVNKRALEVKASAGIMARAWDDVATHAAAAWQAMKNVGAQQSLEDQAKAALANRDAQVPGGATYDMYNAQFKALQAKLVAQGFAQSQAQAQQSALHDAMAASQAAQAGSPATESALTAQIEKIQSLQAAALSIDTDRAKRAQDIAFYTREQVKAVKDYNAQLREASGTAGTHTPGARAPKAAKDNSNKLYQMGVDDINKQIQAQGKLDDAQARGAAEVKAFTDNLDEQLQTRKQVLDLQVQAVGMGDKEVKQQQELYQIQQKYEHQQAQLDREHANHSRGMTDANYAAESAALKAHYEADIALTKEHYAEMDAAQANWVNGAIAAMQNWADQGANVADQTKTLFTDAFTQMNDALANFVTRGKLNFTSLVTSILTDLAKMELRIAESQILPSIIGMFMPSGQGVASSYMAGGGSSYAASGVNWNVGALNANGGVYSSASLSRYSGGVYDKPHFFTFANGGVFGEDGPEAIMPLTRGQDGKLGVKAQGGGNVIHINTSVVVDQNGARSTTTSDSSDSAARQLGAMMEAKAKEVVSRAVQPGGLLWRHGVGQAA